MEFPLVLLLLFLLFEGCSYYYSSFIEFPALKHISDARGRMAEVAGILEGARMLLLNVYGPNIDDPVFFEDTLQQCGEYRDWPLVWGGDFNVVLHASLDTTTRGCLSLPRAVAVLRSLIQMYRRCDVWRNLSPAV